MSVCYFTGGRCRSARTRRRSFGPFDNVDAFHDSITEHLRPRTRDAWRRVAEPLHNRPHNIVLTHGDLAAWNILVDEKTHRLVGIIDWEYSGWYPEYWEYACALRPSRAFPKIVAFFEKVFPEYQEEIEIEKVLWDATGPF